MSGWDIDKEDLSWISDTALPDAAFSYGAPEYPEEIDARKWYRGENQMQTNSCQGFALSGACENTFYVQERSVIQFSPWWCYVEAQRVDGWAGSDGGSSLTGGLKAVKTLGVCPEAYWPFTGRYNSKRPAGALEAASKYIIKSHRMMASYDHLYDYLGSGQGGIWIGCNSAAFHQTAPGILGKWQDGGGGHSTAVLGYTKRRDPQGRKYLLMWNSGYPVPGWNEVAPAWWDVFFTRRNSLAIGLSNLTTPGPRTFPWGRKNILA